MKYLNELCQPWFMLSKEVQDAIRAHPKREWLEATGRWKKDHATEVDCYPGVTFRCPAKTLEDFEWVHDYNFMASDKDGWVWAFTHEPILRYHSWGRLEPWHSSTRVGHLGYRPDDWRTMIRKREREEVSHWDVSTKLKEG